MPQKISYEFDTVRLWSERGILFCQFLGGNINHQLIEKDVYQYLEIIDKLAKGNCMPLLVDLRDVVGSFSIGAAKILINNTSYQKNILCEAFVTNKINNKLLVLSYKRIYEPDKQYKIFNTFKEALDYCVAKKRVEV